MHYFTKYSNLYLHSPDAGHTTVILICQKNHFRDTRMQMHQNMPPCEWQVNLWLGCRTERVNSSEVFSVSMTLWNSQLEWFWIVRLWSWWRNFCYILDRSSINICLKFYSWKTFLSNVFSYLVQVHLDKRDLKKEFDRALSITMCTLRGKGSTRYSFDHLQVQLIVLGCCEMLKYYSSADVPKGK